MRFGEADLRELGRGIGAHERNAAPADDRRDDDQVSAALLAEERQRRPRREIRAHVVHVEQLLHARRLDLIDRAVDAEAGIADHHIEPSKSFHGPGDELVHVRLAGDVRGERQHVATCLANFVSR